MAEGLDRQEFVAGYLVEVEEHLRAVNKNLLAIEQSLERDEPHPRLVRELFRSLHTLKGLSAMVGIEPIVLIAHEMETIVRKVDHTSAKLSLGAVELLLAGIRAIEQRVAVFASGQPVPAAPVELLDAFLELEPSTTSEPRWQGHRLSLPPELLSKLSEGERVQLLHGMAQGRRAVCLNYLPSTAHAENGTSITTVRERVGKCAEIVKIIPRTLAAVDGPPSLAFALLILTDASDRELMDAGYTRPEHLTPIVAEPETAEKPFLEESADELGADQPLRTGFVRVDVKRLDDALDKLASLVVTRFRVMRAVNDLNERGIDVRELASILHDNARQLRDLRASITRARMVSVAELLERVPLIVRGMTKTTGKQVKLTVDSGKAELDKAVAERVFPAIVHLVRNAVDHAIESPDERRRAGKPEIGSVTVSCHEHSTSQLELRVTDDGRGIDRVAIAIKGQKPVPEDNRGLLDLVTTPGLSTLAQATQSSGRGMGMEIVKRIVDALSGTLELTTSPNVGTSFALRIPLSVSMLESFSFVCAGQSFVVAVSTIEEIVEIDPSRVFRGPTAVGRRMQAELFERRGAAVPLFSLARVLGLGAQAREPRKALVVRRDNQSYAFSVDRMLGQQEIVVRPLEDALVKVAGVAGATDLGDGKPTLVLDLLSLVSAVCDAPRDRSRRESVLS